MRASRAAVAVVWTPLPGGVRTVGEQGALLHGQTTAALCPTAAVQCILVLAGAGHRGNAMQWGLTAIS